MYQFVTDSNSGYSLAEQAQMFVEAGGMWIQLATGKDESAPEIRDEINMVMEIAKNENSFLVIEHNVELVNELKVHGVHLFPGDMLPKEARELLGPHAVVGVTVTTAEEVINLRSADIDYVQIGPYPEVSIERYINIVKAVREQNVEIPIVASGYIANEDIKAIMETGVNGIATGTPALKTNDPTAYFRETLEILSEI